MDDYLASHAERSENVSGVLACIHSMDIPFELLLTIYDALAWRGDFMTDDVCETVKNLIPAALGGEHENLRALATFWDACTARERAGLLEYFRDVHTAFMYAEDVGDYLPPDETIVMPVFHPVDDQWRDMIQLLQHRKRFAPIWSMEEPECVLSSELS